MKHQVADLVESKISMLWVVSHEYSRVIRQVSREIYDRFDSTYNIYSWDINRGLRAITSRSPLPQKDEFDIPSPVDALGILNLSCTRNVVFLLDMHLFLEPKIWRQYLNNIQNYELTNTTFIIISPIFKVPEEIEKYVFRIEEPLPDNRELFKYFSEYVGSKISEYSNEEILDIISGGTGLTEFEFICAIRVSARAGEKVRAEDIREFKQDKMENSTGLSVSDSRRRFDTLIGMDTMKKFSKGMVNSGKGKGILILGVPGTGKSEFARALGNETGRLTINFNLESLLTKYVGETERVTANALKSVDAMSPAILFIDEIENALAGVSGSSTDSGTAQRQGGILLKWLSDHKSDVYVVATSNSIEKIPPEFLRAGRWDAIFFVDMPNEKELELLVEMYKDKYGIVEDFDSSVLENFTGAEVESLCRIASSLDMGLEEALEFVCPLYKTFSEQMLALRDWAQDRTILATSSKRGVSLKLIGN